MTPPAPALVNARQYAENIIASLEAIQNGAHVHTRNRHLANIGGSLTLLDRAEQRGMQAEIPRLVEALSAAIAAAAGWLARIAYT